MTTIYSKAGTDAAIGAATAVQQVTLTAPLAYTLPAGVPADVVHRVVFTQTTGGHTVTYGGQPVTVALAAGASTTVELHPVGAGYVARYPASGPTSGINTGDQDLSGLAVKSANLSDLTDPAVARANLGTIIRSARNILDYGVATGTTASQTTAIKAALDANPGTAFHFPRGDYRLDTTLVVGAGNSLLLDRDARIYAATPMTHLIDWTWAGAGYSEDKAIIGGKLDGALNAATVLRINKVIRFTLSQITISDGINRGLFTGPTGAELIATDVRLHNTTISNVADNIAIEATMGDSHFRDVIMRDWTVAVKDTAANRWDRVHPWIGPDSGAVTQMTSRYPTSIAFDITGASDLDATLSDTYRTAYKLRTNGTGYTAPPRLINARAMWADNPTLPSALAAANPAYVLDNTDAVGAIIDRLTVKGHTVNPANFLTGVTTNLTARNVFSYGYVKGYTGTVGDPLDYRGGILQGVVTFTPTIYGSNAAGTHTYNSRSGRLVIDGDVATYFISINATLDATTGFGGAMRLGGIPLPPGATNTRTGVGMVAVSNAQISAAIMYGSTAPYVSMMVQPTAGSALVEVDIAGQSLRGKTVDITFAVSVTHYKA